ncbi:hypothetical protein HDU96_000836 [Phlyctochytrium bullatum]|nr:hypothetical protein HDU96_000836 [Phlyctochytrium bullatum]
MSASTSSSSAAAATAAVTATTTTTASTATTGSSSPAVTTVNVLVKAPLPNQRTDDVLLMNSLHQRFIADNPTLDYNYEVAAVNNDDEYLAELRRRLASDNAGGVDLFLVEESWMASFPGQFADLLDIVRARGELAQRIQDQIRAQSPQVTDHDTVAGRLVGLPYWADYGMLYYRRDVLERFNITVPTTWSDIENACNTINAGRANQENVPQFCFATGFKNQSVVPSATEWLASSSNNPLVGGGLQFNFDEPGFAQILGTLRNWTTRNIINPQLFTLTTEECLDQWLRGNVVFYQGRASHFNSSTSAQSLILTETVTQTITQTVTPTAAPTADATDSASATTTAAVPSPTVEVVVRTSTVQRPAFNVTRIPGLRQGMTASTLSGYHFALSSKALGGTREGLEAATRVMLFLTSREVQTSRMRTLGVPSTYQGAFDDTTSCTSSNLPCGLTKTLSQNPFLRPSGKVDAFWLDIVTSLTTDLAFFFSNPAVVDVVQALGRAKQNIQAIVDRALQASASASLSTTAAATTTTVAPATSTTKANPAAAGVPASSDDGGGALKNNLVVIAACASVSAIVVVAIIVSIVMIVKRARKKNRFGDLGPAPVDPATGQPGNAMPMGALRNGPTSPRFDADYNDRPVGFPSQPPNGGAYPNTRWEVGRGVTVNTASTPTTMTPYQASRTQTSATSRSQFATEYEQYMPPVPVPGTNGVVAGGNASPASPIPQGSFGRPYATSSPAPPSVVTGTGGPYARPAPSSLMGPAATATTLGAAPSSVHPTNLMHHMNQSASTTTPGSVLAGSSSLVTSRDDDQATHPPNYIRSPGSLDLQYQEGYVGAMEGSVTGASSETGGSSAFAPAAGAAFGRGPSSPTSPTAGFGRSFSPPQGAAAAPPTTTLGRRHEVVHGYDPVQEDELRLRPGDQVVLHTAYDDGYAYGTLVDVRTGRSVADGVFPLACLIPREASRDVHRAARLNRRSVASLKGWKGEQQQEGGEGEEATPEILLMEGRIGEKEYLEMRREKREREERQVAALKERLARADLPPRERERLQQRLDELELGL